MTRQEIFTLIDRERAYQTQRWGTGFDRLNTPNDWVTYIAKVSGVCCHIAVEPEHVQQSTAEGRSLGRCCVGTARLRATALR